MKYHDVTDDGDEVEITLPSRKEVCPRCHGNGTHVNPSIDGNGISTSDECWQDDDFREMYFGGGYDVTCEECGGNRVVDVVDESRCSGDELMAYEAWLDRQYQYEAERRSEMRWGY